MAATASSATLVDTGQVSCFDDEGNQIDCPSEGEAFYGQDAQYAGVSMQYEDNSNGTVSDASTRLMWQQDDNGDGLDWENALAYCSNLELAGSDDSESRSCIHQR